MSTRDLPTVRPESRAHTPRSVGVQPPPESHPAISVAKPGLVLFEDGPPSSSRYRIITKIASGGMATVYVGCLQGPAGFERIVAIKRAHPHLLEDPSFKQMLIAEAQLAARTDHPNVVGVKDVEDLGGELLLIMDYVEGAALSSLLTDAEHGVLPPRIATRVILDACEGLQAVHDLTDTGGEALGIVHRDISPQNILVGVDGTSRVADFGIAKKASSSAWSQHTAAGTLRGKPGYMAPEYIATGTATPLVDVFALGVVAWEAFTRRRLFRGQNDLESLELVRRGRIPRPSEFAPTVGPEVDAVVLRALGRDPATRFQSAREFGEALEAAGRREDLIATIAEVRAFVALRTSSALQKRRAEVRAHTSGAIPVASAPKDPSEFDAEPRPRSTVTTSPEVDSARGGLTPTNVTKPVRRGRGAEFESLSGVSDSVPPPSSRRRRKDVVRAASMWVGAAAMLVAGHFVRTAWMTPGEAPTAVVAPESRTPALASESSATPRATGAEGRPEETTTLPSRPVPVEGVAVPHAETSKATKHVRPNVAAAVPVVRTVTDAPIVSDAPVETKAPKSPSELPSKAPKNPYGD
ncbi:MAG: protein kinase [Polyangiaceae bacterium]